MKILFASDISFAYYEDYEKTSAEKCMKEVAEIFRSVDFSVVNLENVFGNPKELKPIVKSGPNLISDASFVNYLDVLNPTVIGLANNHCGDYGEKAIHFTMNLLTQKGYECIGAGNNIDEAYKPAVFNLKGTKVAVFAVCENEFGIAEKNKAGAAGYNLVRVTDVIRSSRQEGMIPIIYFHGGNENNPFPSPGKTELYRYFADCGAGAVIAMHTHCPQGYEIYNGCPIIYSMGNFFFPATECMTSWYYGYMTILDVSEKGIFPQIIPYRFKGEKISLLSGDENTDFMEYIKYISNPIKDDEKIKKYFDSWCMTVGLIYANQVKFSDEMLHNGAYKSKELKNIFSCEAHNELILNTMKIMYEERAESAKEKIEEIKILQDMKIPEI